MSQAASNHLLQDLSGAISECVSRAAQSMVAIHSNHSRSSGFIWRPGLIVTADEALADEGNVSVTLAGGNAIAATVVGRDSATDVALLRIEHSDCAPIALQTCSLQAGAIALAIGSRQGTPAAAFGIISFVGDKWRSLRGGEIDARIELDLSLRVTGEGSLAIDAAGHAFGMVVAGPRRQVLVIPATTIERVADTLHTHGRIPRGYLGLGFHPIQLDGGQGTGVMVMSVEPNGPGAAAGLKQGDIVTKWNGQPIQGMRALLRALGSCSVGSVVKLDLQRAEAPVEISLSIGERPET